MPIHSIISEYDIFANAAENSVAETRRVKGGYVEMVKQENGYRLQRLISTDPSMYLRAEYQPTRYYQ